MKRKVKAACCILLRNTFFFLCLLLSVNTQASVTLSGVLQQGVGANGETGGSPIWNTLGDEFAFANLYLTQPNSGYTAPFLNSGNGTGASVSYVLSPGTYDFFYFVMGFWDNNPGQYGLNLFFDGNNTTPGISAFSPANTITATPVAAGLNTLSLDGDNDPPVTSQGGLTFISDGLAVTLTGYGFGQPGQFGGPALDRVGNLNNLPDLASDSVGRFTLEVTTVPEPSIFTTGCLAMGLLALFRKKLASPPRPR